MNEGFTYTQEEMVAYVSSMIAGRFELLEQYLNEAPIDYTDRKAGLEELLVEILSGKHEKE